MDVDVDVVVVFEFKLLSKEKQAANGDVLSDGEESSEVDIFGRASDVA